MAFSRGHWDYPEKAHVSPSAPHSPCLSSPKTPTSRVYDLLDGLLQGDKRNPEDFERWRKLAEVGKNTDREVIPEQATIDTITEGRGDLEDIDENAPTL